MYIYTHAYIHAYIHTYIHTFPEAPYPNQYVETLHIDLDFIRQVQLDQQLFLEKLHSPPLSICPQDGVDMPHRWYNSLCLHCGTQKKKWVRTKTKTELSGGSNRRSPMNIHLVIPTEISTIT
jgi:hypothetical protein